MFGGALGCHVSPYDTRHSALGINARHTQPDLDLFRFFYVAIGLGQYLSKYRFVILVIF